MTPKRLLPIAIAMGLIVSLALFFYMRGLQKQAEQAKKMELVKVLIAAKPIPARTIITKDLVGTKDIPKSEVSKDMVTNINEVVNKVVTVPMTAGDFIFKSKFAQKRAELGLSFIVPRGKRAVTIRVDEVTGIAGLLKPGDFVDVLSTFELPRKTKSTEATAGTPPSMCVTVLQNAQVLALGQMMEAKPPEGGKEEKATKPEETYTLVTLAVNPKDAERLHLIAEKGLTRLILRPYDDFSRVSLPGTTLQSMMGKAAYAGVYYGPEEKEKEKPKPVSQPVQLAPAPPSSPPSYPTPAPLDTGAQVKIKEIKDYVEVIKGTQREEVGIK